jgi:tetratricopeptide (TPR) repeat protein
LHGYLTVTVGLALSLFAPRAGALTFSPTEIEWAGWPEYCQARYMVSGAGVDSAFAGRVSTEVVQSWEKRFGPQLWYSLHHYCAGLILTERAKIIPEKAQRHFEMKSALAEYNFTYTRIPPSHALRAEIAARMGLIYRELGDTTLALQYLDQSIEGCPTCPVGYLSKSMYFRSAGHLDQAREVLEQADAAMGGESAEVQYFLGLVLVGLKDYDGALEQARKVYGKGYPLPGLKDQLARAGYPLK